MFNINHSNWTTKQIEILCREMPIHDNIVCLLQYGSIKQKEDFNSTSDLDFHLVCKKIDQQTLVEIKYIFGFSNKIDLSIQSIDEIVKDSKIFFQNGNQGLYFMHVLCSSEVIFGENIYKNLIESIDEDKVKSSIIEKIREYIWRLRRNYIFENNLKVHQKYLTRIIKDILILEKHISYKNIADFNNRQIINLYIETHKNVLSQNDCSLVLSILNIDQINNPDIESLLVLFSDTVNQLTWNN